MFAGLVVSYATLCLLALQLFKHPLHGFFSLRTLVGHPFVSLGPPRTP